MLINANALQIPLADKSVQMCVTSPPYWGLRDYEIDDQLGLEPTPEQYVENMVAVFREVKRVLRDDGVLFLNLGDTYNGSGGNKGHNAENTSDFQKANIGSRGSQAKNVDYLKPKDLVGIPWRVALALQADGWWLRSDITWCKTSPMPESVKDRPTKATEHIFMFAKSKQYYYDHLAVRKFSDTLNSTNSFNKTLFESIRNRPAPLGSPPKSGNISLPYKWFPYIILSAFLSMQRVLVKNGDDVFSKFLDVFFSPGDGRIGWAVFVESFIDVSPDIVHDVFKHIDIILSDGDLDGESELWIRLLTPISSSVPDNKCSLPIKKSHKIMSKIVRNAKVLRDTISINSFSESGIDINIVNKSISLLESSDFGPRDFRNPLITKSTLEKFDLLLSNVSFEKPFSSIGHGSSKEDNLFPPNYNMGQGKQQGGHNLWNWWTISAKPYSGAHYAVFPPEIPEICIRAGTSEKGQCPECGAPWERVIEKEVGKIPQPEEKTEGLPHHHSDKHTLRAEKRATETTGWKPTCEHYSRTNEWLPIPRQKEDESDRAYQKRKNPIMALRRELLDMWKGADAVSQIVLDPFVGSGTTCMVARELGRRSVGIDLSYDYLVNNARKRLSLDALERWQSGNGRADESELDDLPMFGGGQPEKHHKNMETPGQKPHTMHERRLDKGD